MTRERPTLQTVASLHGLLLAWETDEGVIEARYDYDALVAAAEEAALRGRENGGDRWERVKKAPTTLER